METNEIVVPPEYTEAEVAALTGLRRQTLRAYRCRKVGIPYIKRGNTIAYRQSDVHAYLQGERVEPQVIIVVQNNDESLETSTALATEESSIEAPLENSEMGTLSYGAAD